jgi:hypothetical protein
VDGDVAGRRADRVDGGRHDLGDADRLQGQRERARLEAAHVEQVLDERAQPVE